ncbi:hypothetical protein G6F42_017544 [Rhizopus arrhizus]|nr:hypothetical protein G6F42_017544 [Rhizopus arrhizus]
MILLTSYRHISGRSSKEIKSISEEAQKSIQTLENLLDDDERLRELLSEEPNLFKLSDKAKIQAYLPPKKKPTKDANFDQQE